LHEIGYLLAPAGTQVTNGRQVTVAKNTIQRLAEA
jgi:hypothetical protein